MKVDDEIRQIAHDDLIKALTTSNRNLAQNFQLSPSLLKSPKELREVARKTEESAFSYSGENLTKYAESILTLIVFLTDRNLSSDAVLVRFMLNYDLEDLFADTELFPDLLYADISVDDKRIILDSIVDEISAITPRIIYDYMNYQPFSHTLSIRYSIPRQLKSKMRDYREEHLEKVISKISGTLGLSDSESDSEFSTIGDLSNYFESDSDSSSNSSYSPSISESHSSTGSSYGSHSSAHSSHNSANSSANSSAHSSYSSHSSAHSSTHNSQKPQPKNCQKCDEPADPNYTTILEKDGIYKKIGFCGADCMENWNKF